MILAQVPRLPQCRLQRRWSQAHLAGVSGVSRTEVSAIETGRLVPSVAVALRLAAALGESVETLFGGGDGGPRLSWAWGPGTRDTRLWRAVVNGRLLAYPVEPTAAGCLPHDGTSPDEAINDVGTHRPDRTLVVAGCDPLAGLLMHEMADRHGIRVLPLLRSSGDALDLLRRGLVHAAGIHLTNRQGHSANEPVVRSRLGGSHVLLRQLQWDAGIALGSSRSEKSLTALLRARVTWVNREEGSAARDTFERVLGRRARPAGYERIARGHRAIAEAVSGGWAEAGVCIRPSAVEARLGFITLNREAYDLCVSERDLDDPRIVALVATVGSRRYRQLVAAVPGCDSSASGEQRVVQ